MPTFSKREKSKLGSLLSPPKSRQIPGLIVAYDAITEEEEKEMLQQVDESPAPWTRRRTRVTKNYGPYYLYTERNTPEGRFRYTDGTIKYTPLPPFLYDTVLPIVRRAVPLLQSFEPNQLHVALYRMDEDGKIHMHNDNKMGELGPYIVGMCLLSDCEMTFVRPRDKKTKIVKLPRRCVYVMSEESHFEWRHGILSGHTNTDRVSFTLRDVRKLAVEEGVKVKKSSHTPTEHSIQQQRVKDALRSAGISQSSDDDIKLTDMLN